MEFKKPNRRTPAPAAPRSAPVSDTPPAAPPPQTEPKPKRRLFSKKVVIGLGVAACIVAGFFLYRSMTGNPHAAVKKPTYQTILPEGKTIQELGGWKRVSPPEDQPVFAFADSIDDVPISVTEQPLPQAFKNDPKSQVADLAAKFNATGKIDASGVTAYIGSSVKGPQSVIFSTDKLLILIKSDKKISDTSWARYISSLLR